MNDRLTKKDKGLLKGAFRRVFSRSELRRRVVAASLIEYVDSARPRVKKWSRCKECKQPVPAYLAEVDHREPLVPLNMSFDEMSLDLIVDRLWCEESKLDVLCKPCHKVKSKSENAERRKLKKEAKK